MEIFETVADMVASTSLSVGDHARTLGYTTIGDGGGNDYDVVAAATGTADGGEYIDLILIKQEACSRQEYEAQSIGALRATALESIPMRYRLL